MTDKKAVIGELPDLQKTIRDMGTLTPVTPENPPLPGAPKWLSKRLFDRIRVDDLLAGLFDAMPDEMIPGRNEGEPSQVYLLRVLDVAEEMAEEVSDAWIRATVPYLLTRIPVMGKVIAVLSVIPVFGKWANGGAAGLAVKALDAVIPEVAFKLIRDQLGVE